MVRAGITLILFVTVFAMMREISYTWREQLPSSPVNADKGVKVVEGLPEMGVMQPTVPAVMPDLKSGYIFNEERLIESEAVKNARALASAGNDLGIKADIAQLTYSGSIIGDTFRQALVSFPPGKKSAAPQKSRTRQQRTSRSAALETAQLKVGDVLSGYQVAEISADKITFKKGDEVLEKFLYDPDKTRVAPIRKAKAPSAATPNRPRPVPSRASAPEQATSRSADRATRRMVVRKPPPMPDTSSRAGRRSRTVTPPVSTPPMPTLHK